MRSQSSFQVTTSGPPRSKVRFVAASSESDWAKKAATSSTQIGCSLPLGGHHRHDRREPDGA